MVTSLDAIVDPACIEQLSQALSRDALFLTPNTRLATVLRVVLDELAGADGDVVWSSPMVMPFDTWAASCWRSAILADELPPKLLLGTMQDSLYWEQALTRAGNTNELLSKGAAAKLAQQGYTLLVQSQLDIAQHRFDFESAVDSRAFYQWVQCYRQIIDKTSYIGHVDAQAQLLQLDMTGSMFKLAEQTLDNRLWLKPIVMVGFQAPTALQMAIVNHLARSSDAEPAVSQLQLHRSCQQLSLAPRENLESELTSAARWSQQLIADNPQARIAIVIQNLAQNRMLVERIFTTVFSPQSVARNEPELHQAFNISAGIALSQASVIKVAMLISRAISQPLKREEWLELLLSPFIAASGNDLAARCSIINALYDAGEAEYRLAEIVRLLSWRNNSTAMSADASEFIYRLEQLNQRVNSNQAGAGKRRQKKVSQWLPLIRDCLDDLGWPDTRTLNSDEYQQVGHFNAHCEDFSQFDTIAGELSLEQAASLFRRHCQSQIYHRETVARPAGEQHVQVLGQLEASGQTFDHLWLCGMSDREWPAAPQAHPLIPVHLQVQYSMPASSVEHEFNYAKNLGRSYLNSAPAIVLSYPQRLDDIETQLSPLMRELIESMGLSGDINAACPESETRHEDVQCESDIFEYFHDSAGCPLPVSGDEPASALPGGAGMLKDHNQNPLRAYFKWRLGVRPLGEIMVGVSPLERGNILHSALESIWQALGGQAALQDCSIAQVRSLVQDAVESACQTVLRQRFKPVSPALITLEQERINHLLEHWLLLESQRPEFVINSIEKEISFKLGDQKLVLRIDRIDRLADGRQLLIDYKSGVTSTRGWYDATITEPQLPLYAMAESAANDAGEIDQYAIAFASLKASQPGFEGMADEASAAMDINGFKPVAKLRNCDFADWSELFAYWQQQLLESMAEISRGSTEVDFRYYGRDQSVYRPASRQWTSQSPLEEVE